MNIIRKEPNVGGAYPPVQTWHNHTLPNGYAVIPDSVDMTDFYEYNGFVTLQIIDDIVTSYRPNVEAWEEWMASLPEPTPAEPTIEKRIAGLEDALCEMDATNETRMAAIEDALCEMDME